MIARKSCGSAEDSISKKPEITSENISEKKKIREKYMSFKIVKNLYNSIYV